MCNSRKITVRATRQIAEAWRAEIERTVRLSDIVSAEARIVQPLGSMLSGPARQAFEQAVGTGSRWMPDDGGYRMSVPGGEARYRPSTGELEIRVQLSSTIEVVESASRELTGVVEDTVETAVEGQYYTDGYRGQTLQRAEQEAGRLAEAEADRQAAERAAQARRKADRQAEAARRKGSATVRREAELAASARLAGEREQRRVELEQEAAARLDRVQQSTLRGVFETVAQGYQTALLTYARRNGAFDVQVSQAGGSIEIQFEMEA
jgi:hypothetical protein